MYSLTENIQKISRKETACLQIVIWVGGAIFLIQLILHKKSVAKEKETV